MLAAWIALAALAGPLTLEVVDLRVGAVTEWTVAGAAPGDRVVVFGSTAGPGAGPCLGPLCVG